MYQALYRKYRPRTFDDVAGQEHITETLKNQLRAGRISHAYLFIGTRGTGKTTCAKILARAVNCEHPEDGNPCNKCPSCLGIEDGSVMDVVEIDAASNTGVDNVRALRDEAIFTPSSVKKRVYIIDEVHMLSPSAFNALLKILEEPPGHLIFILATTELSKIPATVLSRCQRYGFRRLDSGTISGRLDYVASKEAIKLDKGASELIARLADGSLRDALSLLDQCSGREIIDTAAVLNAMGLAGNLRTADLLNAVALHDTEKTLEIFKSLWQDGKDPASLLTELSALCRDILVLAVAPKGGAELLSGAYDAALLRGFIKKLKKSELLAFAGAIQSALFGMRSVQNPRTAAELCLISLCEPSIGAGLPELRARVERLEASGTAVPPRERVSFSPAEPDESPAEGAEPEPLQEEPPAARPELLRKEPRAEEAKPEPAPETAHGAEEQREPQDADLPPGPPSSDEALWDRLKSSLENLLPIGIYNLLLDKTQVGGSFDGDKVVLRLSRGFIKDTFNKPDILNQFRDAAEKLTGRPVPVSIEETEPSRAAVAGRLDSLSKFKEVKFI